MLAYQNPVFQTEIDKSIGDLKTAIDGLLQLKKAKYINVKKNDIFNTYNFSTMDLLTLINISIQLQKVDTEKTVFKIETQSPLGGGLKGTLQRVLDKFVSELTDILSNNNEFSAEIDEQITVPKKVNYLRVILVIAIAIIALCYLLK